MSCPRVENPDVRCRVIDTRRARLRAAAVNPVPGAADGSPPLGCRPRDLVQIEEPAGPLPAHLKQPGRRPGHRPGTGRRTPAMPPAVKPLRRGEPVDPVAVDHLAALRPVPACVDADVAERVPGIGRGLQRAGVVALLDHAPLATERLVDRPRDADAERTKAPGERLGAVSLDDEVQVPSLDGEVDHAEALPRLARRQRVEDRPPDLPAAEVGQIELDLPRHMERMARHAPRPAGVRRLLGLALRAAGPATPAAPGADGELELLAPHLRALRGLSESPHHGLDYGESL